MIYKTFFILFLLIIGNLNSFSQSVGTDKDKHGCIASAGYTYSNLKKECIRIFEQSNILKSLNSNEKSSSQTCLIFSADKKNAEVFIEGNEGTVLKRFGRRGHYIWKNKSIMVGKTKGYYIKKLGKIIYSQE